MLDRLMPSVIFIQLDMGPCKQHILLTVIFSGGMMDKKEKNPKIIRIKDKEIKESTRAFGEWIKTFRKEAGYSQKELAEMMNVTRNSVINWEAGKYRPDADLFPRLCDILEITLNDLFGIHPENRFTLHERSLIDQYRRISKGGQRIVDHVISDLLD